MLTAQARYATLQAMGGRVWVPRYQLPGAAPSRLCDWPEPETRPHGRERLLSVAHESAVSTPPEPAVVSSPPPTDRFSAPVVEATAPAQADLQPAPSVAPVITTPLQLDVWLLANHWQLVVGSQAMSETEIRLLQSLLTALADQPLGVISRYAFAWPIAGVPLAQGDEQEKNASLRAFLCGACFMQARIPGLLVLDAEAAALLAHQDPRLPALPPVYSLPHPAQMLADPAIKQHFWQQAGDSGLRAHFASSPVIL